MKPLVKICGITTQLQAIEIADSGANYIGINFWPQSKRFTRFADVKELIKWRCSLPGKTDLVGVFVNPSSDHECFNYEALDAIQLHGEEPPEFCAALLDRGFRVIKAFQVRDEAALDSIVDYPVNDILLDAYHPTERGGIGATFPWELALSFKQKYPAKNLWLAGGLTPDNVAEAVAAVQPYAVDTASGVESGVPGTKDMNKVSAFIREAKA